MEIRLILFAYPCIRMQLKKERYISNTISIQAFKTPRTISLP